MLENKKERINLIEQQWSGSSIEQMRINSWGRKYVENNKLLYYEKELYQSFVINPISKDMMEERKNFSVVTEEDVQYAVIYKNNEACYLEEVHINGNEIEVDTSKQKIVPGDNLTYENMEFENVIIAE